MSAYPWWTATPRYTAAAWCSSSLCPIRTGRHPACTTPDSRHPRLFVCSILRPRPDPLYSGNIQVRRAHLLHEGKDAKMALRKRTPRITRTKESWKCSRHGGSPQTL
uniref:Uncharacterized protein n=1 Tax=Ixodes ricinus TaxID=34613 RepID=A0A6B0UI49_IXORI